MLTIQISQIPEEGLPVDTDLRAEDVSLEGAAGESAVFQSGHLTVRAEKGDENSVHVRGRLRAGIQLQCGRCLEPFSHDVDQAVDQFYLPHEPGQQEEDQDDVKLEDRDMVIAYHQGDRLDLAEMVREQVTLALPLKSLCREDCKGLCAHCGQNQNLGACSCAETHPVDPRLSPLALLFGKDSGAKGGGGTPA